MDKEDLKKKNAQAAQPDVPNETMHLKLQIRRT